MFHMVCSFAQRLNLGLTVIHDQLVCNAFSSTRQVDQLHRVAPTMKFIYVTCVFHGRLLRIDIEFQLCVVRNLSVCKSASTPKFHNSVVECMISQLTTLRICTNRKRYLPTTNYEVSRE